MSGLFSNLFDPGQETGSGTAQGQQPGNDGGQTPAATDTGSDSSGNDSHADSQNDSLAVNGDGSISADPSVHLSQSGSYEGIDGSDNQWSHSNDVGLHADTGAMLTSANTLTDDSTGTN